MSQLLVESLLLGLAGGVLGLAVAWAGVRFLVTSPVNMARLGDSTLNMPVIAFTFALAVACAVVFGLFPALHAARLDLQQTLRDGGREGSAASRDRLRGLLVVGELCLAQVLLIGAVLLIRSAALVAAVPPGFSTNNLMIVNVRPAAGAIRPTRRARGRIPSSRRSDRRGAGCPRGRPDVARAGGRRTVVELQRVASRQQRP